MLNLRTLKKTLIALVLLNALACGPVEDSETQTEYPRDSGSGGLAGHLLKAAEVEALSKQLVRPFEKADDLGALPGVSSKNVNAMTAFMTQKLNQAMGLPALSPGRTLRVKILDAALPNAMADGDQNVFITAPFLINPNLTANRLLAVLCHEMAHSALNHASSRGHDPIETAYSEASEKIINDYLKGRWDGLLYTHDKSAWLSMAQKLKNLNSAVAFTHMKHTESEADVVGGMICGEIGMNFETYADAFGNLETLLNKAPTALPLAGPGALPDQSKFSLADFDLGSYITMGAVDDDHPSNKERIDQVMRYKQQIAAHYRPQQTIARDWNQYMSDWLSKNRNEIKELWKADDLLKETSPASLPPTPVEIAAEPSED